jgi:hypothetical protein
MATAYSAARLPAHLASATGAKGVHSGGTPASAYELPTRTTPSASVTGSSCDMLSGRAPDTLSGRAPRAARSSSMLTPA